MNVDAGPSIFLDQSAYKDWKRSKASYKNRRASKELSKDYKDWEQQPLQYSKRNLKTSLLGNNYWMPEHDANELEHYVQKNQSVLSDSYKGKQRLYNVQTPADFIDYAFTDARLKNVETAEASGGHILSVSYNSLYKILIVKFAKQAALGDTCAFFDLPANVAALLLHYARTNQLAPSDGKHERHMLGVEFWNLVRVRGTLHNTRYAFEYTNSAAVEEAVAKGNTSIDRGTVGRPLGSKGKDNKYYYDDSGRRYHKDEEGNPIIGTRGRPKGSSTSSPADALKDARSAAHKEYVERLTKGELSSKDNYLKTKTSNIDRYNAAALYDYLNDEYGMYHDDINSARGSTKSHMQNAYDIFKQNQSNMTDDIVKQIKDELRLSGYSFERPEDL